MDSAFIVALVMAGAFVVAFAVDRGIPNALESCAYLLEQRSAELVAALRGAAARLRARHVDIERANRRRMNGNGLHVAVAARDTRGAA